MILNCTRFRVWIALAGAALLLGGCGGGKGKLKTPTVGERLPVLSRIEASAKADPQLAQTPVILPAEHENRDWAQGGGEPDKSYGNLALSAAPVRLWTAQIAGSTTRRRLAAAPVVGNGRLFVIDTTGVVHAMDADTGRTVWRRDFSDKIASSVIFGGGVSYDLGKVYVTTGAGDVAALNADNGDEIWSTRLPGPLRGAPTIAFNSVYVMTQDNQIHALDAANGKVQWSESGSPTQAGLFGIASPAAGQGTVVAGYSSGEVVAYRYENGRHLWADALARTSISTQVAALTDVDADPIIDQGWVYALGQGGRMAAYDLVTGQRVWELNLSGISTPALAGDWIFTLTNTGNLLAIDRRSGRVRWLTDMTTYRDAKVKANKLFWTGPVLAGSRLWLANTFGHVVTVDPASGTAQEFADLGAPISLPPIVAKQTLYVLKDNGQIVAFR